MTASDEPTRLATIVSPLFRVETPRIIQLDNNSSADLVLSASDQDDCAAFRFSGDQVAVFGSDYVRGAKFSLYEHGYLNNYDIGWFLAGANWSDIAAMGATPAGLLSVVRYPKAMPDEEFEQIMLGIRDCCDSVGGINIGGDIGTAERIILSGSAIGVVEPDNLLKRSGARPGQVVLLTGPTGLAGSALKYGTATERLAALDDLVFELLLHRWRRVAPRFEHGRLFGRDRAVTSCVDTSDGLSGALQTICSTSGVGMDVNAQAVPVDGAVLAASHALCTEALELVFGDSVDFELVATADEHAVDDLLIAADAAGLPLHVIGRVTEGELAVLVNGDLRSPLPGTPWRHTS